MIITKTPYRISFVGGGSDMDIFYHQHQGAVINVTIDKYIYISSHPFFDEHSIRLKYSKTETVNTLDEIQHPLFREVLKKFGVNNSIELSSIGDAPGGTGLGSSSAFTVGLLHNMYARNGVFPTKRKLAEDACNIENVILKEPNGKQDQYAAAYGGFNVMYFNPDDTVTMEGVYLNNKLEKELESNLLLFYTGVKRSASTILQEQKGNANKKANIDTLVKMVDLVWDMRDALYCGDLSSFGEILDKNWILKQSLASGIGTEHLTEMYNTGIKAGASGGKVLGAGGGGFMLFYCDKDKQETLRKRMYMYRELKFKFNNEGSKVIFKGDEDEG